jgi:hypothetical protein
MPHPRRLRCLLPRRRRPRMDGKATLAKSSPLLSPLGSLSSPIALPRPVITKPTIYTDNKKKTAVINLFNYKELQWKEWTSASMALHQAMINSIGALILATIERLSGHAGIISPSCRQLFAHITVIFGALHASDVFFSENHIKEGLTPFAAFRHFATLSVATHSTTTSSQRFRIISARSPRYTGSKTLCSDARNSISPSVRGNQQTAVSLHARTTTLFNTHRRNTLPYHLIRPATVGKRSTSATTPTRATMDKERTKSAAEAKAAKARAKTATVRATIPNANDNNRQHKRTPPPKQKTTQIDNSIYRNGWENDPSPTTMAGQLHQWTATLPISFTGSDARTYVPQTKTADHRFYCAVYGHNTTHNGVNCRTILRDQQVYTRQHLQARQPGDCTNPAGNDNVQFLRPRLH